MKIKFLHIKLVGLTTYGLFAQNAATYRLKEVVVSDDRVQRYADGHKVIQLNDSVIDRNGIFTTALLNFNTPIYFRENGFGMVASPSFRGTNASHTAVIWNGINVNSPLNGQTDFNTINPLNYSSVAIRSGGGSVQFGTGAIGGSIHLNNDLKFSNHKDHQVLIGFGSFDSRSVNYSNSFGANKWSANFGVNYNGSDNDYAYLETEGKNTNGEFEHLNINFNTGVLLANNQALRLYHQSFLSDRNLSGTLVAPSRSRYQDKQHRTQLEWMKFKDNANHKVKIAHLHEAFTFYENASADFFTEGRVTTLFARYAMDTQLTNSLRLNTFVQYNHLFGNGDNFESPQRNDWALTALLKHTMSDKFRYNVSLRQDFSSDFSSPLVFSTNGSYSFSNVYILKWNASRNFRLPTFNDLYWQPGGNLNLQPEQSYQFDIGHQISLKHYTITLNNYFIRTQDMIRWLPNATGIWSPGNIDDVQIYGAEVSFGLKKALGAKQAIKIQSNYAYTISQDLANQEQLIYVPRHSGNASLAYQLINFECFYQHRYNGTVQIIGGQLKGYQIANLGFTYKLKTKGKLNSRFGVILNNVFNTYYENVALRPMPNRHIQTQLILNF